MSAVLSHMIEVVQGTRRSKGRCTDADLRRIGFTDSQIGRYAPSARAFVTASACARGRYDRLPLASRRLFWAAHDLLTDVRRRYPGQALRCPYMIALDKAVAGFRTAGTP